MSINLESLKKAVGKTPTPTPTNKPAISGGSDSMGSDIGYLVQILVRSLAGSFVWLIFKSHLKKHGLGWLTNDFWTFLIAILFCYVSDTKLRFLNPFQKDLVLGILGESFLEVALKFTK